MKKQLPTGENRHSLPASPLCGCKHALPGIFPPYARLPLASRLPSGQRTCTEPVPYAFGAGSERARSRLRTSTLQGIEYQYCLEETKTAPFPGAVCLCRGGFPSAPGGSVLFMRSASAVVSAACRNRSLALTSPCATQSIRRRCLRHYPQSSLLSSGRSYSASLWCKHPHPSRSHCLLFFYSMFCIIYLSTLESVPRRSPQQVCPCSLQKHAPQRRCKSTTSDPHNVCPGVKQGKRGQKNAKPPESYPHTPGTKNPQHGHAPANPCVEMR